GGDPLPGRLRDRGGRDDPVSGAFQRRTEDRSDPSGADDPDGEPCGTLACVVRRVHGVRSSPLGYRTCRRPVLSPEGLRNGGWGPGAGTVRRTGTRLLVGWPLILRGAACCGNGDGRRRPRGSAPAVQRAPPGSS